MWIERRGWKPVESVREIEKDGEFDGTDSVKEKQGGMEQKQSIS